jgi:hypothetical protein
VRGLRLCISSANCDVTVERHSVDNVKIRDAEYRNRYLMKLEVLQEILPACDISASGSN